MEKGNSWLQLLNHAYQKIFQVLLGLRFLFRFYFLLPKVFIQISWNRLHFYS